MIVPIGTTLHEIGHYIIAKFFFQLVEMQYGVVDYTHYIGNLNHSFSEFLVTLGGPISTILVSLVFTFILFKVNLKKEKSLLLLPFSLFISREVLISSFILLKFNHTNTDEFKIFNYLELNPFIGASILLITSIVFCGAVIYFKYPRNQHMNLLLFGTFGSVLGFVFWNYFQTGSLFINQIHN
tara:strand:- start:1455 stop:2003 length:549 start_codon:yes stop_codon:yes gene_type:complete